METPRLVDSVYGCGYGLPNAVYGRIGDRHTRGLEEPTELGDGMRRLSLHLSCLAWRQITLFRPASSFHIKLLLFYMDHRAYSICRKPSTSGLPGCTRHHVQEHDFQSCARLGVSTRKGVVSYRRHWAILPNLSFRKMTKPPFWTMTRPPFRKMMNRPSLQHHHQHHHHYKRSTTGNHS
jgi:hypothetical protein